MAIPEHVKRQAMDAVSHKETTDMIRSFKGSGADVSEVYTTTFTHPSEPKPEVRPIPDEVKKQAMDAINHPETKAQIRLVRDNGAVTPPITPARNTDRIADKVAQLHKSGQDVDTTQRAMTKDNFGREHG